MTPADDGRLFLDALTRDDVEAARLWRNGAQDHSHGRLDEENLNGCAG